MPAITANAKDFLINSDYPVDQIIYLHEGSVTLPGFGFSDIDIPHGLPFTPLPFAQWSTSPTWDVAYEISSGPLGGNPYTINTGIEANGANITFRSTNNIVSSGTVYYRIYGFMPSDASGNSPHTNTQDAAFIFSSEYNYTKLFKAGVTATLAASQTEAVIHGLDYYPQVLAWKEKAGVVTPVLFTSVNYGGALAQVTTSSLLLTASSSDISSKFHYRIYADE